MNKKQQLEIQKTLASLTKAIDGLEPKQKAAITKHLGALHGHVATLIPDASVLSWQPVAASAAKPKPAVKAKPKSKK